MSTTGKIILAVVCVVAVAGIGYGIYYYVSTPVEKPITAADKANRNITIKKK